MQIQNFWRSKHLEYHPILLGYGARDDFLTCGIKKWTFPEPESLLSADFNQSFSQSNRLIVCCCSLMLAYLPNIEYSNRTDCSVQYLCVLVLTQYLRVLVLVQYLSVLEIVSPQRSDLVLAANVPDCETDVLVLDRLHVKT